MLLLVGEAHDLVLDRRAVARADDPGSDPEYIGARCRFARMMSWTCGVVAGDVAGNLAESSIRSVRIEKGTGGSSPGWTPARSSRSSGRRAAAGCRSSGGPARKPSPPECPTRPRAGASPTRPAGIFSSPRWISPRRNVPVVRMTAPAPMRRAVGGDDAGNAAVVAQIRSSTASPQQIKVGLFAPAPPAWPRGRGDGRPGRAGRERRVPCSVEHAELDAGIGR